MEMSRRYFLSTSALIAGTGQREMTRLNAADAPLARRFFMDLSCGRIGVKATFLESIDLAVRHGFEGVDPDAKYFGQLSDLQLGDTLAQLLMLATSDQRESLLATFSRRSATAQVTVLKTLVSAGASDELLRLLLSRAHTGKDALEIRSAIAPVLTQSDIDDLLSDALASDHALTVITNIAPYLSAMKPPSRLPSSR